MTIVASMVLAPTVAGAASPVFDNAPDVALEAAAARLADFVETNPEGSAPVDCPLLDATGAGTTIETFATERSVVLQPQLDPWTATVSTNPELRPDDAPAGVVAGLPLVRCTTVRPADGGVVRPELFALTLRDGVSVDDVARVFALDPVLFVPPAGVGGELGGSCLATRETAVCVAIWSRADLVVGLTLEGPPAAVNTTTGGALLAELVPEVVDHLAVVRTQPPECTRAALEAGTGIALVAEPLCSGGWAVGRTVECPPPPVDATTTTTPGTLDPCATAEVFHVTAGGWQHDGPRDVRCAESLAELGMTVVTATAFAPPCDADAEVLADTTLRPGTEGARVRSLQIALVGRGYVLPVDGRYGPLTTAAVIDAQVANNVTVDGITGAQTRATLGI